MPTYEYRCPEGHTFELFQRMTDDPPVACAECGASPVEKVLFAPAIHYRGSGFYATDYGRGKAKKDGKDGDSSNSDAASSSTEKSGTSEKKTETKSAEASS